MDLIEIFQKKCSTYKGWVGGTFFIMFDLSARFSGRLIAAKPLINRKKIPEGRP